VKSRRIRGVVSVLGAFRAVCAAEKVARNGRKVHADAKSAGLLSCLASRSRALCALGLMLLMAVHLVPTALGAESVASEITAMPVGTKIEVRLKNKRRMSGITGQVSSVGFALVDSGKVEHQIAFDDVDSVKTINAKSHVTRNVLIGVGVGAVVVVGITAAVVVHAAKTRGF